MKSSTARDTMQGIINTALNGQQIDIAWQGKAFDPSATKAWARVTILHTDGGNASLACINGERRYVRLGQISVQVFWPSDDNGLAKSFDAACLLRDAIQAHRSDKGLWFRNATANEVGVDGAWFNCNATATFEYNEVTQ